MSSPVDGTRHSATLLVTDLDNTLFDWFDVWYHSFSAMLDEIVAISGASRERLLAEIRAIHQRRGTSEYSYLIEEIPALNELHPAEDLAAIYKPAIDAFKRERQGHLQLYPGVEAALRRIKSHGASIVAYTESLGFYSQYRLKLLGLDGVIDYLYSPEDHEFPDGVDSSTMRSRSDEQYELQATKHRFTPSSERKPNSHILHQIINESGAEPLSTVYVGDSLMKDIVMAQDVGVLDVYAKYGYSQDHPGYELLQSISHWTEEDVEREKAINAHPPISPTLTLDRRFDELLAKVAFHG